MSQTGNRPIDGSTTTPRLRRRVDYIATLRQLLETLVEVSEDVVQEAGPVEDHGTNMAVLFLCKQIDHADSILLLLPRRDVILVARSMLEGLSQLCFARSEPDSLPEKWAAFSRVHDWRLLRRKLAAGEAVAENDKQRVMSQILEVEEQFLTPRAKRARDGARQIPDDPFHVSWRCDKSLRSIFEQTNALQLYEGVYGQFSDWHHWGAGGLGAAITSFSDGTRIYESTSPEASLTAVHTAFFCLNQTATITARLCGLDSSALESLRERYLAV